MERWAVKLICLFIIFVVTEVCTLLPLKVSGYFTRLGNKGLRYISYLMCFGGGVFLGLYMLHMSPDVHDILNEALIEPNNIHYPLTDFIIAMGLFLILIIEKLVLKGQKRINKSSKQEPIDADVEVFADEISEPMIEKKVAIKCGDTDQKGETALNGNGISDSHTTKNVEIGFDNQNNIGHGYSHGSAENDLSSTRSLLLLLALSLHHVFEGMSVGLKHTSTAVWALTIAIISHEFVIAFCLGMQLVSAYKSKLKVIIAATMCSAMVPVGVFIGMLIMETGGGDETNALKIVNGVLQALSTGVFIYVTYFEILGGEINHEDSNMTKVFFLLLGFFALAGLGLVPESGTIQEETMGIYAYNHTTEYVSTEKSIIAH